VRERAIRLKGGECHVTLANLVYHVRQLSSETSHEHQSHLIEEQAKQARERRRNVIYVKVKPIAD
jgi:hypothetical protein